MKHLTEVVSTLFLSREQAHRAHLDHIDDQKSEFDQPCDGPLLNIIDEIGALYAKTLYKLRNLS